MWTPKVDGYTTYMGEQCLQMAPSHSFQAFKTISSDDVLWDVYFNSLTKEPHFAISENSSKDGE